MGRGGAVAASEGLRGQQARWAAAGAVAAGAAAGSVARPLRGLAFSAAAAPPASQACGAPPALGSQHDGAAAAASQAGRGPTGSAAAVLAASSLAAGLAAGRAGRGRPARAGRARGQPLVRRRFFNFGEPAPEVDPDDPGRVAMCGEYQNNMGPIVYAKEGPFGWATVAQHSASEQDGFWPGGAPPGEVTQEWRELRLAGQPGSPQPGAGEGTGQSVVKVSLCDGQTPAMVPYCMCLAYTKSMCALAMTGAHLQGALPLDDVPALRALVVGLGAGSMPVWLNHTFPDGKMTVDAVEIDPAVISTAREAMGFPGQAMRPTPYGDATAAAEDAISGASGEPVRVYAVGGEAFVEALAAKSPDGYVYDMVFVDAFDKAGAVPPVLVDPEGPFLKGLSGLLAPRATIVLNLLVGMTGSGSSGGPKEIASMTNAIYRTLCDQDKAEAFMVRTPINESSGNVEYTFLRQGRQDGREKPLKDALAASAEAINDGFPPDALGKKIRFEFKRRVNFAYSDWSPGEEDVQQRGGGGGGGFFGF